MYEPDPTMSAADPVVKARTTDVDVGKPAAAALEAADLNAMPGGQPPGRSLPGKAGAGPENGLGGGYGGGGLASVSPDGEVDPTAPPGWSILTSCPDGLQCWRCAATG